MLGLARHVSVALLILAVSFAGMNAAPAALPRAQAQQVSVAGAVLGLTAIAGIVYLITRDQNGAYYRYPYGQYSQGGYRYNGAYAARYPNYRGEFYNGPLPHQWSGNQGEMNWNDYHQGWTARCRPPQGNGQGGWGRQQQYNSWCQQNQRYRNTQPDSGWNQAYPWDRGRPNDGPGK